MSELSRALSALLRRPKDMVRAFLVAPKTLRALDWKFGDMGVYEKTQGGNPLRAYFQAHTEGRGIWKWDVYFDAYHAAMQSFVGKPVKMLEIGIYSGGSLPMWKTYLGEHAQIYGLDIEQGCKEYEEDRVTVFYADQSDQRQLRQILRITGSLDIVVDDGSHLPDHQIASFEAIFPNMNPGGVYIIEDVCGIHNRFTDYLSGLTKSMCAMNFAGDKGALPTSTIQRWVESISVSPYIITIKKRRAPLSHLLNEKRGTQWAPFSAKAKGG